jgi:ribonuclease P protein component
MVRNTLDASERLKREKDLDALFRTGKAHSVFPVRAVFRLSILRPEETVPVRVAVSAPKKKFKRAHDRNRVKRLLREAWRMQKAPVYAAVPDRMQLHLMLLFSGKELPTFNQVQAAISKLIPVLERFVAEQQAQN